MSTGDFVMEAKEAFATHKFSIEESIGELIEYIIDNG